MIVVRKMYSNVFYPLEKLYSIGLRQDDFITDDVKKSLRLIMGRYLELGRFYHNFDHVLACMDEYIDYLGNSSELLNSDIILAILYHDIEYDTHSNLNEELSFVQLLNHNKEFNFGLEQSRLDNIHDLILSTKDHTKNPNVLTDVDLSILGQDPETYNKYAEAIRLEYCWVPEKEYTYGRIEVLSKILASPIYCTSYFKDKYQEQAIKNISNEIAGLKLKTTN